MRLERSPAGECILFGHVELRVSELPLAPGFSCRQLVKPTFGLLAAASFKLGLSGMTTKRLDPRVGSDMRTFLPCERDKPFHAAHVRSQARNRRLCKKTAERRVEPFTRTVGTLAHGLNGNARGAGATTENRRDRCLCHPSDGFTLTVSPANR